MQPPPEPEPDAYFVLSAWCTVAKAWHDAPARYCTPDDARAAARERGIYRVAYVRNGDPWEIDTWAVVGDD